MSKNTRLLRLPLQLLPLVNFWAKFCDVIYERPLTNPFFLFIPSSDWILHLVMYVQLVFQYNHLLFAMCVFKIKFVWLFLTCPQSYLNSVLVVYYSLFKLSFSKSYSFYFSSSVVSSGHCSALFALFCTLELFRLLILHWS